MPNTFSYILRQMQNCYFRLPKFLFSSKVLRFTLLQIVGELIYRLIKKKKKTLKEFTCRLDCYLFQEVFGPSPSPPPPPPPWGWMLVYFIIIGHQKQRGPFIYLFLKPLLGINLSHLNYSLSFLSSHYFKQKPQEVAMEFPIISFHPLPVFRYQSFLRLWGMQTTVLEYEIFSFKPDAF